MAKGVETQEQLGFSREKGCDGYQDFINLKTEVCPRKTRKARNKSSCCVDLVAHSFGDGLQLGISLKIFVLFVFFVDEMIFLGSIVNRRRRKSLSSYCEHNSLKVCRFQIQGNLRHSM